MDINQASFRDPAGYVLEARDSVYRIILPPYKNDWLALKDSGLFEEAKGLIEFNEIENFDEVAGIPKDAVAVLKSPRLPFISYPYEWSFHQLKEAAQLTLELQLLALGKGFTLKDASAYNVQFSGGKPVFIDLLSFERLRPGAPWDAYGQFCSHFLAPLSLMSLVDERLGLESRLWIDGIPLDLAASLLPFKSRFKAGLYLHLHLHAKMQGKYAETGAKVKDVRQGSLSARQLKDIARSLLRTVSSLQAPQRNTEWGDYYSDTNYTEASNVAKKEIVSSVAAQNPGKLAADFGANTGVFSALLAPHFDFVLAPDIDHAAVDRHWLEKSHNNILPLVQDLANPSPAIGYNNIERPAFKERCQADFISALALVHHLRITAGIPLEKIASGFMDLLTSDGKLLIEFVPKTDSQVQRLLKRREDIYSDYTPEKFLTIFAQAGFKLEKSFGMPETYRTLHLFGKKS